MWKNASLLFFLSLILVSCGEDQYHSTKLNLESGVWSENVPLIADFSVSDTTRSHNLYLDIKHSKDYGFQNIYCLINTRFPDGNKTSQTLPINFADKKGAWYGKCNSKNCKLRVVLQENTHFKLTGDYNVEILQYSREKNLDGIYDLNFVII